MINSSNTFLHYSLEVITFLCARDIKNILYYFLPLRNSLFNRGRQTNKLSAVLTGAVPAVWTGCPGSTPRVRLSGPHTWETALIWKVFPQTEYRGLCLKNIMVLLFHKLIKDGPREKLNFGLLICFCENLLSLI